MKYFYLVFIAVLFAGCNNSQGYIEIKGTANGINFGLIAITDQSNNLFKTNIEAGKFNLGKQYLQASGYYKLTYSTGNSKTRRVEIYLEPGTYAINIDQNNINNYPLITSSSKIQTQLSAYNAVADSIKGEARKRVVALNKRLHGLQDELLRPGQYSILVDSIQTEEFKANQVDESKIFNTFISKYPDSDIAAHLMLKMNYQDDAVGYYKLFQKFSENAKSSDDGKELESKLKPLVKVTTGETAPVIAGSTTNGATINIKALNKKIILLDFWRSSNGSSRDNHQQMRASLLPKFGKDGLGIISVSFDTEKDKWTTAIQHDGMTWPQVSDLKGDDSPNAENWGIKSIPSYYLLDTQGRIIEHVNAFLRCGCCYKPVP